MSKYKLAKRISDTDAALPALVQQSIVSNYFQKKSVFWEEIYQMSDVYPVIQQQRAAIALDWFDRLQIPAGSKVLEVGCGAGITAAMIAKKGVKVNAVDAVIAMVKRARTHAKREGVAESVTVSVGDAHDLLFASQTFAVVLALGVTPFLHSIQIAMSEFKRVLRPGGYLIISADNRLRLNNLLDPKSSVAFAPMRRALKNLAGIRILRDTMPLPVRMYSPYEFDEIMKKSGMEKVHGAVLGFGPFTFFGRSFIPAKPGLRLHRFLQGLANRDVPILRTTGSQYVAIAHKPLR